MSSIKYRNLRRTLRRRLRAAGYVPTDFAGHWQKRVKQEDGKEAVFFATVGKKSFELSRIRSNTPILLENMDGYTL